MKTEIGRCRDCQYWKLINKMGDCVKTINGWIEGVGSTSDDGNWDGGIITGPDFGCVHWEEKE